MRNHLFSVDEAEENLLKAATYLAESIGSSDGHADALKEISAEYIADGDVDTAAALADTIEDPFVRDRLLLAVAEKCAAVDDDEYALQLVDAIEQTDFRAVARERLAIRKASIGEFDKAFAFAEHLAHPSDALAAIAVSQAARNLPEDSNQTLEQIEFPLTKVNALLAVAANFEAAGEREKAREILARAFETVEEIEFKEEKIRALQEVAEHFRAVGLNDKSIEALAEAQAETETLDGVHRDGILSTIALGFLKSGSLDLAEAALDLIEDKVLIASTLAGYAMEFDAAGEREDALDTVEESYQILKSQSDREVRDSPTRFDLFGTIAVLFARYGKPERALEIASENPSETARDRALGQIARESAATGDDENAHQAPSLIDEDSARLFALLGLSEAGDRVSKEKITEYLDEARQFVASVPQYAARSSALNELTEKYRALGETEKARAAAKENFETVAQIRDESAKAVALLNLARVFKKHDLSLDDDEKKSLRTMLRRAEF